MKFLNKKEDVIDLEITPYGKSLLSRGKFQPEYYAFYDDEILYNSAFAGFSEHQNSASIRIKEVPQLQTQTYFYSCENQVREGVAFHRLTPQERAQSIMTFPRNLESQPYVQDDGVTISSMPDKEFNKSLLGNSAFDSSYSPSWNVNVIEGQISSSAQTLGGMSLPIPQMNMSASVFEYFLSEETSGSLWFSFENERAELDPTSPMKPFFLNAKENSIILEISEDNTSPEWENFDIEIFEVEEVPIPGLQTSTGTNIKEFLRQLCFIKDASNVENNILRDASEVIRPDIPITADLGEYYFNIQIDNEIDPSLLCDKATNKSDGLFSRRIIDCETGEAPTDINIEDLYDPWSSRSLRGG